MERKNESREIGLDTRLKDLERVIEEGRQTGRIKKGVSNRVIAMLGYLSSDEPSRFVPRKMDTVGELYTLSEHEILYGFKAYKKKTWLKLNEILEGYGLPSLSLPQAYTADHQSP